MNSLKACSRYKSRRHFYRNRTQDRQSNMDDKNSGLVPTEPNLSAYWSVFVLWGQQNEFA